MLHTLTIAEAHDQLKCRKISARELTEDCMKRIEDIDGKLNAVIARNFEGALAEAKKIDDKGTFDHPLTGIPYLAKDVFCEKGVATTACSNVLRDKTYIPPFDSTTTTRLKASGAISLGKTNTDEFTMGASTETSCYGPTRCPWDTTRVAGGSSGGSAAAVGADEAIFAMGTDTGGSIRQPAGFCGCTGLRPTYGRTSRFGVMSMASSLDTIGPIAKNIEDLAIILQAIAGKDPLDATTADLPVPDYRSLLGQSIKGLRVGVPKEYFGEGLNPEVEASVREAGKVLESLGAVLVDISLPYSPYGVATYYVITPAEVSSNMSRYDGIRFGHTAPDPKSLVDYYERVRSTGFGPEVKRRIMVGSFVLSAGYSDAFYYQALKVRTLIKRDFEEAFQKVDVILSPTSPGPAFPVGAHAGDPVAMYLEDVYLCAQPMAGIPALSLPCGFTKQGLPVGLQLMGPQWGEGKIFQAAHAFEQATEWRKKKPAI